VSWLYRITGQFPRLTIARRNISRAKARSALAALSILIGVVAIGSIGAGGVAFKQSQLQSIQEQGATNVFVSPGPDFGQSHFGREDLKAINETVGPAGVVATRGDDVELVERNGSRESLSVTYLDDPRAIYEVKRGHVPANWRRSLVVSHEFAAEHDVGPDERVTLIAQEEDGDSEVEVEYTYRVVAVLAESRSVGGSALYLPIERASAREYGQVRVTTRSTDRAEAVAEALRERFNDRKQKLIVLELTSLVRLFKRIVTGINAFLTALGSISLLVAGVSITNTMLMAVIKRREEIGVLRAVGYRRGDIVRILLLEAALIGVIGAFVGVLLSIGVAIVANAALLGDPFAFTQTALIYLAGAASFGVGTSLVAGVYPAWRAANERPVDALRG
jgi:putative ABC transport system permease protein